MRRVFDDPLYPGGVGQFGLPGVLVHKLHGIADGASERAFELWPVGEATGAAHLQDELFSQFLLLRFEGPLQLPEAVLAERTVGGPVRLVEGAPSGGDGTSHVLARCVRDMAQQLLGRGVHVREGPAIGRIDKLSVNEQPRLGVDLGYRSHSHLLLIPPRSRADADASGREGILPSRRAQDISVSPEDMRPVSPGRVTS